MFTEQTLIHINIACITFMFVILVILVAATRLKNGVGYMALVSASTTIPVYLSNLLRVMDSATFELSLYVALTMNVLCFPFLWFFIRRQLDKEFRFTPKLAWHLLPSLVSLAAALWFYAPLSDHEMAMEREWLETGRENLPAIINDILLFGQFFIYFPVMFRFVYRKKRYVMENYTDSDYVLLLWLPRFLWLFFILFFIVFVAYIVAPRTDVWLIPILNTVGMSYLTYCAVVHSSPAVIDHVVAIPTENPCISSSPVIASEEMQVLCDRASDYAISTKAYLRPNLTLAMLAQEMEVSPKLLSKAINTYLNRNFFEFINGMRVKEAQKRLLELDASGYNIDSIYEDCGFRSRSTFFLVFKKTTGKTPAAWLAGMRNLRRTKTHYNPDKSTL
ncbi:helix-turn-helix domain-containing protein [Parabacteroides sp.]